MGQEGYDVRVLPRKFNETNPNPNPNPEEFVSNSYSYNFRGKIMLAAIVLLFFVVILMLCLHVYARWYLRRARRRHRLRRRTQLDFNSNSLAPAALSRGLDAAVLATLPVFTFDPKTEENALECAVCLSEFEPGQTGRVLPKCNHSFHTECIDMWFHSHATCPLCRAPVERAPEPEVFVVTVRELDPGSGSGSGSGSVQDKNRTVSSSSSSTSVGSRKSGVAIEVPPRDEIFQNELGRDSPSTQSSFRSPMSRMLSFTRILSRERKESVPPSPCGGACSSAAAELDVERGGQEETK